MPSFPIIDAHVHLWDPQRFALPWLAELASINRPFGLEAYQAHTAASVVEAFVAIEAGVAPADALAEAGWLADLARREPRLRGIVAAAPLEAGAHARTHLAALAALGAPIKGVRRLLQSEPDPDFCLRPGFIAGVRLLPQFGLSFDLCIAHHQLPAVVTLVDQCPATSFILDHGGKPAIKAGALDPWRDQIRRLAARPNVVCKVSGLVTEAAHEGWTNTDLAPYVAHLLAEFGPERVLFGSDWPVALLAASYARWVATLDTLAAHLSPAAQRQLWGQNARRIYRLEA